jgi:hypothetical protein
LTYSSESEDLYPSYDGDWCAWWWVWPAAWTRSWRRDSSQASQSGDAVDDLALVPELQRRAAHELEVAQHLSLTAN